jgi:hypothetical protein
MTVNIELEGIRKEALLPLITVLSRLLAVGTEKNYESNINILFFETDVCTTPNRERQCNSYGAHGHCALQRGPCILLT